MTQHNESVNVAFTATDNITQTVKKLEAALASFRKSVNDWGKTNEQTAASQDKASKSIGKTGKEIDNVSKKYAELVKHFRRDKDGGLGAPLQAFEKLAKNAKAGGAALDYAAQRANLVGRSLAGMRAALTHANEKWADWGKTLKWSTIQGLEANKIIRLTGTGIELLDKKMYRSLKLTKDQATAIENLTKTQSLYTKVMDKVTKTYPHLENAASKLGHIFGKNDAATKVWSDSLFKVDKVLNTFSRRILQQDPIFAKQIANFDRSKIVQAEYRGELEAVGRSLKIHNEAGLKAIGLDEKTAASKNMLSRQYNAYGQELQKVFQTHKQLVPAYENLTNVFGKSADSAKAVGAALRNSTGDFAKYSSAVHTLNERLTSGRYTKEQYEKAIGRLNTAMKGQSQVYSQVTTAIDTQLSKGTAYGKLLQDNTHRGEKFNDALRKGAQVYGTNTTAMKSYGDQLVRAHQLMTNTIMASDKTAAAKARLTKSFDANRVAASLASGKLVELNGVLVQAPRRLNAVQAAFMSIGQAMKTMAQYATGAIVIHQLMRVFASGISEIKNFDQAMKDVQAIINATDNDIAVLSETVKDVAANTKYSMTEVADGMKLLGQAGLDTAEIIQAITHTSHLATGTLSTFKEASDLVTTAVRAFGLSFADTQRVVDVFANAINRSKLTVDKIRVAFNYVAPVARAAGVSFEETTAALMTLANAGIRASTMGTALRQVLMHLQQPNAQFRNAILASGMTLDDVNPRIVGFAEAIDNLATVTPTAVEALQFFKLRAAPAVAILVNEGGAGLIRFEKILQETGAAARMFATQTEGLGIKWKQVADKFSVLAVNLGEAGFGGVLRVLADLLRGLLDIFNLFAETIIGKVITGMTMASGAALLLSKAFAGLGILKWITSLFVAKTTAVTASTVAMGYYAGMMNTSAIATTRLAAVTAGFFTLLRAHPFVFITAALVGVYQAYQHLINKTKEFIKVKTAESKELGNTANSIHNYQLQIQEAHKKGENFTYILQRMINDFPELAKEVRNAGKEFEALDAILTSITKAKYQESFIKLAEASAKSLESISRAMSIAQQDYDKETNKINRSFAFNPEKRAELLAKAADTLERASLKAETERKRLAAEMAQSLLKLGYGFDATFEEIEEAVSRIKIFFTDSVSDDFTDDFTKQIFSFFEAMRAGEGKFRAIPISLRDTVKAIGDAVKQQSVIQAFEEYSKGFAKLDMSDSIGESDDANLAALAGLQNTLRETLESIGVDVDFYMEAINKTGAQFHFETLVKNIAFAAGQVDEEGNRIISSFQNLANEYIKVFVNAEGMEKIRLFEGMKKVTDQLNKLQEEYRDAAPEVRNNAIAVFLATEGYTLLEEILTGTITKTKDYTAELKKQKDAQHSLAVSLAEMRGETRKVFDLKLAKEIEDIREQFKTAKMDGVEPFVKEITKIRERDYLEKLNKELKDIHSEFYSVTKQTEKLADLKFGDTLYSFMQKLNKAVEEQRIKLEVAAEMAGIYWDALDDQRADDAAQNINKLRESIDKLTLSTEELKLKELEKEFADFKETLLKLVAAGDLTEEEMRQLIEVYNNKKVVDDIDDSLKELNKTIDEQAHKAEIAALQLKALAAENIGEFEKADQIRKLILQKEEEFYKKKQELAKKEFEDKLANASSWSEYWRLSLAKDLGVLETTLDRKRAAWAKYYDIVKTFVSSIDSSTQTLAQDSLYWAVWESDQKKEIIERDYKDAISRMEEEKQKEIANAQETIGNQEELAKKLEEIDKAYDEKRRTIEDEYYDKKKEHGEQFKNYWKSFLDSLVKSFTDMVAQLLIEWVKVQTLKLFINPIMNAMGLDGFNIGGDSNNVPAGAIVSGGKYIYNNLTGQGGTTAMTSAQYTGALSGGSAGAGFTGVPAAGGGIAYYVSNATGQALPAGSVPYTGADPTPWLSQTPQATGYVPGTPGPYTPGTGYTPPPATPATAGWQGTGMSGMQVAGGAAGVVGGAYGMYRGVQNRDPVSFGLGAYSTYRGGQTLYTAYQGYQAAQLGGQAAVAGGASGGAGGSTAVAQTVNYAPFAATGPYSTATQGAVYGSSAAPAMSTQIPSAGAYAGAGIAGSLGYTYLGGAMGLPQSQYSGATAGLGAMGGMWLGAKYGSAGGPIGAIAGAIIGGVLGGLMGGSGEAPPSVLGTAYDLGQGQFAEKYSYAQEGGERYAEMTASAWEYMFREMKDIQDTMGAEIVEGTIKHLNDEKKYSTEIWDRYGEMVKQVNYDTVMSMQEMRELSDWEKNQRVLDYTAQMATIIDVANEQGIQFTQAMDNILTEAFKETAVLDAAGNLTTVMPELAQYMMELGQPINDLNDILGVNFAESLLAASEGTTSYNEVLQEYVDSTGLSVEAIEELARQTGNYDEALHDLQNTVVDSIGSYQDAVTRQAEAAGVAEGSMQQLIQSVFDVAATADGTAGSVMELMAQTGILSEEFLDAEGAGQGLAGSIQLLIDYLRDATGQVGSFAGSLGSVKSAASGLSARASGGPVSAGQYYLVGEEGPEIVKMQGAGHVFTAEETAKMLGLRAFARGGSFGGSSISYQIGATTDEARRREIQLLEMLGREIEATNLKRALEIEKADESERSIMALIHQREDEIEAAKLSMDINKQRMSLEQQIADLTGDTEMQARLLAEARMLELAAMDASLHGLQERVWALQDEQAAQRKAEAARQESQRAAQQAIDSQISAVKSQIQEYQRMQDELQRAVDDALRRVDQARQAYLQGLQRELSVLEGRYNTAKQTYLGLLQEELSAQQSLISTLSAVIDRIRSFRQALWTGAESPLGIEDRSGMLSGQMRDLSAQAMGGDVDAMGRLVDVSGQYLDVSKQMHTDWREYARDLAKTSKLLEQVEEVAGKDLTEAEKQTQHLREIIDRINGVHDRITDLDTARVAYESARMEFQTSWMHAEIAMLENIMNPVVSLEELQREYASAQESYQDAVTAFNESWYTEEIALLEAQLEVLQLIAGANAGSAGGGGGGGPSLMSLLDYANKPEGAMSWQGKTWLMPADGPGSSSVGDMYTIKLLMEGAPHLGYIQAPNLDHGFWKAVESQAAHRYNQDYRYDTSTREYVTNQQWLSSRGFAQGGFASPGWAMVGEQGPELVRFNQPGYVYTASQTRAALHDDTTAQEVRELRAELREVGRVLARNTQDTARVLQRWDDGDALRTREDTEVTA